MMEKEMNKIEEMKLRYDKLEKKYEEKMKLLIKMKNDLDDEM